MGLWGIFLFISVRFGMGRYDLLFRKKFVWMEFRVLCILGSLVSIFIFFEDDSGSVFEVFIGGSDGRKEFFVGVVDVWVFD